jgi:hypothetical protein
MIQESKVYALLGKRLVNNEITKELESRIDFLVQHLSRYSPDLVIFTGGSNQGYVPESEKAKEYFLKKIQFPAYKVACDYNSKNTGGNIKAIAEIIQHNNPRNVSLEIFTSDYHQKRLLKVDERMYGECLLRDLHGIKYEIKGAPYPYPASENSLKGISTRLYLAADGFILMKLNLEGILRDGGTLDHIDVRNTIDFQSTLSVMSSELQRLEKIEHSQEAESLKKDASEVYYALKAHEYVLKKLTRKILSSSDREALKKINSDFKQINYDFDPDEAG